MKSTGLCRYCWTFIRESKPTGLQAGWLFSYMAESAEPGAIVYNYSDEPDLSMNEFVGLIRQHTGKSTGISLRIPYILGMAGGGCRDLLSKFTGKTFPVSLVRVKKFCADTTIAVEKLKKTGFIPPFTLKKGIELFLNHEFPPKS
jgi:hypothetical protein